MRESTLWILHLLAGTLLLGVLGIHFIVMHLGVSLGVHHGEVLTFASVSERSGMPFYLMVYLLLLTAALYHGFYGLRSIISEISIIGPRLKGLINTLIVLLGFALFLYGAYTIILGFAG